MLTLGKPRLVYGCIHADSEEDHRLGRSYPPHAPIADQPRLAPPTPQLGQPDATDLREGV